MTAPTPVPPGLDFDKAWRSTHAWSAEGYYDKAELQRQCADRVRAAREEMAETVASAYHEGREQKDRQYAQHLAALEGVRKEEREKASRDTARLDYLERQTTEEARCVKLQGSPPQGLRPTFQWVVHRNGIGYMPWAETVRGAIDKAMEAE